MRQAWLQTAILCGLLVALPSSLPAATPTVQCKITRDVTYVRRGAQAQLADIYSPSQAKAACPGVLLIHGGAWALGNKAQMATIAKQLAEHGYTAVAISYRLAPQNVYPAQIDDCKMAVRWMREHAVEYKIDPARIAAYGYSAGAQLACLLAVTGPSDGLEPAGAAKDAPSTSVMCCVAGGTPCDFRWMPADNRSLAYWLGGSRAEKPELYDSASPLKFVDKSDCPIFLYHGADDTLVPLLSAQAMIAKLKTEHVDCALHVVPKAGHIATFFDAGAATAAIDFLDKHLKSAAPAAPPAGR